MIPGPDIKTLAASTIYFPLFTAFILLFFGSRLENGTIGKRARG